MFFNIGGAEILVIALVALIAIGPEQLPGVMRKVGGFVSQARSVTSGLRDEFMSGMDEIKDSADVAKWTGTGLSNDPIVPRGFAEKQAKSKADGESGDKKDKADDTDTVATESGAAEATTADEPTSRQGAQLGRSDTTSTVGGASNTNGSGNTNGDTPEPTEDEEGEDQS